MLMTIDEYLNCLVADAKALNVAKKGDIAAAIGISSQQLSNLLSGRDYWRATYIDGLCAVTKQRFSWPLTKSIEHEKLHQMLSELLFAGEEHSISVKTAIEGMYVNMLAKRQQPAIKKATVA